MSTVHLPLFVLFVFFAIKTFVNSQLNNQSDRKSNLIKFRTISSQFGLTRRLPFQLKPWLQDSWLYSNNWQPYSLSLLPAVPAHLNPSALIAHHPLELDGPYEHYLENNPSPNLLPHSYNQFNHLTHQNFLESLKRAKEVAKTLQNYSKNINHLQSENKSQRKGCKNKADCLKPSKDSDYTKLSDPHLFSREDDELPNEERFSFKLSKPFDSNLFGKSDYGHHHFDTSFDREQKNDKLYNYLNRRPVSKSNQNNKYYFKSSHWDEEDEKLSDDPVHQDDYMNKYHEPAFDDDQEESSEEPESQFYSQGDLYERGHHKYENTKRSHNEPEGHFKDFYNGFKFQSGDRHFLNPTKKGSKQKDQTKPDSEPHSIKCTQKHNNHEDHNDYDDHYSQYDDSGQGEESRKSKLTINKDKNGKKTLSSNKAKISSESNHLKPK